MENVMNLSVMDDEYSVCRLAPDAVLPDWSQQGDFYSISKTSEELSIVCQTHLVPDHVRSEAGWRIIKVEGPLDFALVGILANLSGILAERGISIFAISTFDTDYLLVKEKDLGRAVIALRDVGHDVWE